MVRLILLAFLFFSCQPLPKDVPLEKYRSQFIEGQVLLEDSLKDKLPKGDRFLIISVRNLEEPMPIAVLRVKNPNFPYKFKVTGKHKLRHDKIMEGDVIITARISSKQTAEPQKGDLVGFAQARVGMKGVKILIDREVE